MKARFSLLFRGLSLLAVSMLIVPVAASVLQFSVPAANIIVPPLTVLAVFLGCFLQALYAAFLGKSNSYDGLNSSKHSFNHYRFSYAVIPVLIAAVISVAMIFISRWTVNLLFWADLSDKYITSSSLIPYYVMILCFISMLSGIIIWFYPIERLASVYTLIASLAILIIEFCYGTITGNSGIFLICLIFYFICATIIYNQSYIQQNFRGSVVTVLKPSDRVYNMFLVLMLLAILVISLGLIYIIVKSLYLLGYSLFAVTVYVALYNSGENSPAKSYEYYGNEAAGIVFGGVQKDTSLIYVFFVLVFLFVLLLLLIRTGYLQRIVRSIYDWIVEFFTTIAIGRDIFKTALNDWNKNDEEDFTNYKDEKKRTQNAAIRDFQSMAASTDSYKLFMQNLTRCSDTNTQLRYAYAVLVRMYHKGNVNLKSSDTPREVEYKVLNATDEKNIHQITTAFEHIQYAEIELSDTQAKSVLNEMCMIIKRYMF